MSDRFYRQTDEAWAAEQKRDWLTADGHACIGEGCPKCAAALALCDHDWLDRPESDTRECLICGTEVSG